MSAVTLVSNPTPDVSTYVWSPPGVNKLSRTNKLSSLPFWAPNDTMKRHQFRLVLLKGLVPGSVEAEDTFGLLLELIPPPDDTAAVYPGGCIVTASLLPHADDDDLSGTHTEPAFTKKAMGVLDAHHTQISFPELVPARYAGDAHYISPESHALRFQIQLQTGANIVAEQVAAPLASLWGAISSTFSSLAKQTEKIVHDVRVDFAQGSQTAPGAPGGEGSGGGNGEITPTPWAAVPQAWEGRGDAWRDLVCVRLGENEGVALYGPERAMTLDEKNALVQVGINPAALMDLYQNFHYDRDVHEGLLESPTLNHMRFLLVPRRMKDETFWANYFWKVACLATCTNEAQTRTLLTVLNAPPAEAPKVVNQAATTVTPEQVESSVKDANDAMALLAEYLADSPSTDDALLIDTAAETCRGHLKQLELLFRRTDLPEAQQEAIGAALRGLRTALKRHAELTITATPPRVQPTAEVEAHLTPVAAVTEESASPAPATPPPRAAQPSTDVTPSAPPSASPAAAVADSTSKARSQSRTSQIEFPKMPWEEEEDEEE